MGHRIALFTRDLAGGGIGRVIVNLAAGFAELGHDVDVVLARRRGPYLAQVPPSVRVLDLGVNRTLRCVPGLVRYLRRERPRALLACGDGANVVALWAKRLASSPVRLLISTHTTVSHNARQATKARGRLIPYFVRRFYRWADDVIAVSQGVAEDLAVTARLDPRRIRVIYNPVDINGILELARAPLAHPWFGPAEPPVIVSAGRLTRQKDYPTLIRAFGLVRRRRPARLLILGEGEDRPAGRGGPSLVFPVRGGSAGNPTSKVLAPRFEGDPASPFPNGLRGNSLHQGAVNLFELAGKLQGRAGSRITGGGKCVTELSKPSRRACSSQWDGRGVCTRSSVVSAAGCRLCLIAATIWGDSKGLKKRSLTLSVSDPMHPGQGVGDGPTEHGID